MNLEQEGPGPLGDPYLSVKVTRCASHRCDLRFPRDLLWRPCLPGSWSALTTGRGFSAPSPRELSSSWDSGNVPGTHRGDFPGPSPAPVPQPGSGGSRRASSELLRGRAAPPSTTLARVLGSVLCRFLWRENNQGCRSQEKEGWGRRHRGSKTDPAGWAGPLRGRGLGATSWPGSWRESGLSLELAAEARTISRARLGLVGFLCTCGAQGRKTCLWGPFRLLQSWGSSPGTPPTGRKGHTGSGPVVDDRQVQRVFPSAHATPLAPLPTPALLQPPQHRVTLLFLCAACRCG